jgi:hypothetical protein
VQDMRRKEELKQRVVRAKKELVGLRTTHRYGLCFWALRRVRYAAGGEPQGDPRIGARVFDYLRRSHFADVDATLEGAELAFAAERTSGDGPETVPWSDWILTDLPLGPGGTRGGAFSADGEILRVFVALLLLSPDLKARAPSVDPPGWLPGRLESVRNALDEVSCDAVLLELVFGGMDDVEQRVQTIRELLERSARLQKA